MKKLMLGLLPFFLSGCLLAGGSGKNHHPYRHKRSAEQPWWAKKVEPGTPKGKNPWMAFVRDQPEDRWHDPWSQVNLKAYGVTPITTAAHATPLKDAKIRMLKLEIQKLKKDLKAAESKKASHSESKEVF